MTNRKYVERSKIAQNNQLSSLVDKYVTTDGSGNYNRKYIAGKGNKNGTLKNSVLDTLKQQYDLQPL